MIGGASAVAAAVVSVFWPGSLAAVDVLLDVAIGVAWIAAGLVAWTRCPELRLGPLMAAVGIAWYWEQPWWPARVPFALALLLEGVALPAGLHAVLAFPSGRLGSRLARGLVAGAYATVLVGNLVGALVFEPTRAACPDCPRNLLLVHRSATIASAVDVIQPALAVVIGVLAVVVLVRRWQSASAAGRAVLGPVLVASAVTATIVVVGQLADATGTAPQWLRWLSSVAIGLVPVAFLAGLLRARLRRSAMMALMLELVELPSSRQVQDALARALRDPTLRLAFWIGDERRYVDLDGAPTTVAIADPARAVTLLDYRGERFAALEHDPYLYEDRELLEAVGAAARMAIDNARLQARLRAQLNEVRASRARIVAAGDAERRRLERDLHDGAQQRLLGVRLALKLARSRVGRDDAEVQQLLGEADTELMTGLDELRALARGIHPAVLTDEGLPAALASLARRATIPVQIITVPNERLAAPVEAAAYFVASEALANVAKHAHASTATITMTRANGRVSLEVADDGVGGAQVSASSGLNGLRDRVEALDGQLEITSQPDAGTTLRAVFPCA